MPARDTLDSNSTVSTADAKALITTVSCEANCRKWEDQGSNALGRWAPDKSRVDFFTIYEQLGMSALEA